MEQKKAIENKKMMEKIAATPLKNTAIKGDVDLSWFGHAGFGIHFVDE